MKSNVIHSTKVPFLEKLKKHDVAKKLLGNSFATGLNFISRWFFNFVLSKVLSNAQFGVFSTLYALGNLLMNCFGFGANLHMIHEISQEKERKYFVLANSFIITSLIALAATFVWLSLLLFFPEIPFIEFFGAAIGFGFISALSALVFSFFKGLGAFSKEAFGFLFFAFAIAIALLVLGILQWPESPHTLMLVLCLVSLFPLSYGLSKLKVQLQEDQLSFRNAFKIDKLKEFWREKVPFGLHEVQGAIYTHINILILAYLLTSEDLGIFKSVQLLIVPVSILPSIVSQVALNQLSSRKSEPVAFKKSFRKFLVMTTLIGAVTFLLFMLLGRQGIDWIYGDKLGFAPVGVLLLCFSLTFLFKFISSNYGVLITSAGNQKIRVRITLASIILSVSLTLILGSIYGMIGAAIAMAAANGTILLGYALYGEIKILKPLESC